MNYTKDSGEDFLKRLTDIVHENMTNQQFGVSMLAAKMGMSRANLHKKVSSILKISVSQFINQERLKKARTILRTSSETVSEVAYIVGFNNVSYFIKCFRKFYGYPPGEVGQRHANEDDPGSQPLEDKKQSAKFLITAFSLILFALALLIGFKSFIFNKTELEKTIAVLPPYYEPQDLGYCKIINGLVQNIIENLMLIKDIQKVTPWMSVTQYKNSDKAAPAIATEKKVNYIVKPSVITYDNKIQLMITLVEGSRDKSVWSHSYDIDINNFTELYQEITKDIALQLNAEITPDDKYKIEKQITSNGKALIYYNEGVDFINAYNSSGYLYYLDSAIIHLENALKLDSTCASAYAQLAITYYNLNSKYLSGSEPDNSISEQIYKCAQMANIIDPELDLTLCAQSFYNYYLHDYELAIAYGEKALKYNPYSRHAIHVLRLLYFNVGEYVKFLEFATKIVNSDYLLKDTSENRQLKEIYYSIGVAYHQLGFFDLAMKYADSLLVIDPDFVKAMNLKARFFADLRKYEQSNEVLLKAVEQGLALPVTYRRLGMNYYLLRDFSNSAIYYKKLLELKEESYGEYLIADDAWHIAMVLLTVGETDKAQKLIRKQIEQPYFHGPLSRSNSLIAYYALTGDTANAMEHMRTYSGFDNHFIGRVYILKYAPVFDILQNIPEYRELISEMEDRFWEKTKRVKKELEMKDLL